MSDVRHIAELDVIRSLGNLLIVFVHCSTFGVVMESLSVSGVEKAFVRFWCYKVAWSAMPVFFLISGYLMMKGYVPSGFWIKVRNRVNRLLIPYLVWNAVCAMGFLLCCWFGWAAMVKPLWAYLLKVAGLFTQPMDTPLWYIRALMGYMLLLPFFYWLMGRRWLFAGVAVVTFLGVVGLSACGWGEKLRIIFPAYSILAFGFGSWLAFRGIDFAWHFRRNRVAYLVLGISGYVMLFCSWSGLTEFAIALRGLLLIALVFFIPCGMVEALVRKRWFKFVVASSFFLYAAHRYPCWWARAVTERMHFDAFAGAGIVLMFGEVACVIVLCLLAYWIINRILPRLGRVLSGQ